MFKPRRLGKKGKAQLQRMKDAASIRRQEQRERLTSKKSFDPTVGTGYRRNDVSHIPSKLSMTVKQHPIRELNEDMLERERIAQVEIERKKKCTAPAYNKGAYQYVATEEQAKDVGR